MYVYCKKIVPGKEVLAVVAFRSTLAVVDSPKYWFDPTASNQNVFRCSVTEVPGHLS